MIEITKRMGGDTETTGFRCYGVPAIKWVNTGKRKKDDLIFPQIVIPARVFGISFCNELLETCWFRYPLTDEEFDWISEVLSRKDVEKIFHNAPFDIQHLWKMGFKIHGKVHDTVAMAHILVARYAAEKKDKGYSLKLADLSEQYLDDDKLDVVEKWRKEKEQTRYISPVYPGVDYKDAPDEIMNPYASKDPLLTMKLFHLFINPINKNHKGLYKIERQLIPAIADMEKIGVRIDVPYIEKAIAQCRVDEAEAMAEIIRFNDGNEINLNSPKQIGEMLIRSGAEIVKTTKNGSPKTDAETLMQLEHPAAQNIIKYRTSLKARTTFFQTFLEQSTEEEPGVEVIHCRVHQNGAKSGRFSIVEPPLQTLTSPSRKSFHYIDVRRAIIAREGMSLLFFDWSQIEIRIFVYYSRCKVMLDAILEGKDIHSATTADLFGRAFKYDEHMHPSNAKSKAMRTFVKGINFGIIFGMGNKSLIEQSKTQPGIMAIMDEYEIRQFLADYHRRFHEIKTFTRTLQRKISVDGYVKDVFGRHYRVSPKRSYVVLNALVQGTAGGVFKYAMVKVREYLKRLKAGRIVIPVHDELINEILRRLAGEPEFINGVVNIMKDFPQFDLPLEVDVERSDRSWSDKKPLSEFGISL